MYAGPSSELVKTLGEFEFNGTYFSFRVLSDDAYYKLDSLSPAMMQGKYTYATVDYPVTLTPLVESKRCRSPTVSRRKQERESMEFFFFFLVCFFKKSVVSFVKIASIYISTNSNAFCCY